MASEKVVKYTADQVAEMVERYNKGTGETVEVLAEAFGKTIKSVIAKLSRERVYQPKIGKTAGEKGMTKAQMVEVLAMKLGTSAEVVESLEKATKDALQAVLNGFAVVELNEADEDNEAA